MRREREALVRQREIEVRDVGGLALEMYRRDRFKPDLLLTRCAEVYSIDERIHELDSFLAAAEVAARGPGAETCRCGAPIVRGAHFCSHCGRPATETPPVVTCSHCGQPLPADVNFCPVCGNGVAAESYAAEEHVASEPAFVDETMVEPRTDVGPPPCPRCGTPPEDPYQEYCLECGSRLFRYPAARSSFFRREAWAGQSPLWMWLPLLALLLLALLLTGIVVWAASDEDEANRQARSTTRGAISIVTGPTTIAPPVSTFTATTLPTTTFATTTIPTTTAAATTTTTAAGDVIAWPSGNRGYTIVLASIPKERGRNAADRKANGGSTAASARSASSTPPSTRA